MVYFGGLYTLILTISFLNAHALRRGYSLLFCRRINIPCFDQSQPNGDTDQKRSIPRINADIPRLYEWIDYNHGELKAKIVITPDGWTLSTDSDVKKHEIMARIPKRLCLSSNPTETPASLSENAIALMESLDTNSWRARLAIALLSERTKSGDSVFEPFIRNLPATIDGMPMFFDRTELTYIQDMTLINKAQTIGRFLREFCDQILKPLHRTPQDPFSGKINEKHLTDVFGWAFAIASSRALRPEAIGGYSGSAVFIPGIDLAQHSFTPTCIVLDGNDEFILMTTQDLPKGSAVTINYGSFTNDDFMLDYGFTIGENIHDTIKFECDLNLINAARSVMRQSNYSSTSNEAAVSFSGNSEYSYPITMPQRTHSNLFSARSIGINQRHDVLSDQVLTLWQTFWLRALSLYAPFADTKMIIGGLEPPTSDTSLQMTENSENSQLAHTKKSRKKTVKSDENVNYKGNKELLVDHRLWAMLRVMYAAHEDDLRRHGYDPFILQSPGSMLSPSVEAHVIKTIIGMLLIILRSYGTDVERDIDHLSRGVKNVYRTYKETADTDIIRRDCLNILRSVINNKKSTLHQKSTLELISMINPHGNNLLTPNLMMTMQYRIHKKRLLLRIIRKLVAMHQQLVSIGKQMTDEEQYVEDLEDMLRDELQSGLGEGGEVMTPEQVTERLLKFIDSNSKAGQQRARRGGGTGEDAKDNKSRVLQTASSLSQKWAGRGIGL